MFTKDNRTENFLTQIGVDFSYTNNLTFPDLLEGWEKINLARPVPIREDAVEEYATLMMGGSAAPAPIVCKTKMGHDILDGVQRIAASQLSGATRFSAYVVKSDSVDVVSAIRVLANARLQGRAEPSEWTRRNAVKVLVIDRGMSVEEVAQMGGWRPSDVAATARVLEWSKTIESIGGPELPDVMLITISKHVCEKDLAKSPRAIAKFLQLIKSARLSTSDAEPFIEDFFRPITKASKIHDIYQQRLDAISQSPEIDARIKGRKSQGPTPDVNLRKSLKSAVTILQQIESSGDGIVYVDEFFKLVNEIEDLLHKLSPSHKQPVLARVPADLWSDKK